MWPLRLRPSRWPESKKRTSDSKVSEGSGGRHTPAEGDSARQHTCLGLLSGHPAHVFGVQFHGVVAQLGFGRRLEVVAAHWQVTVPLHPPGKEKESKARDNSETNPRNL